MLAPSDVFAATYKFSMLVLCGKLKLFTVVFCVNSNSHFFYILLSVWKLFSSLAISAK